MNHISNLINILRGFIPEIANRIVEVMKMNEKKFIEECQVELVCDVSARFQDEILEDILIFIIEK